MSEFQSNNTAVLEEPPEGNQQAIRYPVADNVIKRLEQDYLPLTINGIDDKEGFKRVHDARMEVRGLRIDVETTRKELKAKAVAYGKKVDGEARRLKEPLIRIEEHLNSQEDAVKEEIERIKQQRINERLQALQAVSTELPPLELVDSWSDDEFATALRVATEQHERQVAEEAARLQAEAAERAELERLRAAERERQEAEVARLEAERAELDRQKAELAEAQRELAEAKAEQERIEAKQHLECEQQEAQARAAAEEAERQRLEAQRPDREKLTSVAVVIDEIIVPIVSDELSEVSQAVCSILADASLRIRQLVDGSTVS